MLRGRCPRQKLYSKYCPPVRRSQCNCYTVRCLFFFISLPPARTALRSQTLSIPVIFFTNGDGVNSPSAISSSSAEKVRYCQPYFPPAAEFPAPALSDQYLPPVELLLEKSRPPQVPQEPFLQSGRGVFFLQPMPTVITFGIR